MVRFQTVRMSSRKVLIERPGYVQDDGKAESKFVLNYYDKDREDIELLNMKFNRSRLG